MKLLRVAAVTRAVSDVQKENLCRILFKGWRRGSGLLDK